MIVVLTGAPGAGKGTQADLLVSRSGYRKFSTGDALRKHVKAGSAIGKVAGAIMERGELVPDDVLFSIVKEELGSIAVKDVVLLDGYPRNLTQASALETIKENHPVRAAIQLNVPRAALIARLSGRRVCEKCASTYHISDNAPSKPGVCDRCGGALAQRPDDNPDSVAVRLDVYEKNTRPVLDFYEKKGLFRQVDGTGSPESIYASLKKVIEGL